MSKLGSSEGPAGSPLFLPLGWGASPRDRRVSLPREKHGRACRCTHIGAITRPSSRPLLVLPCARKYPTPTRPSAWLALKIQSDPSARAPSLFARRVMRVSVLSRRDETNETFLTTIRGCGSSRRETNHRIRFEGHIATVSAEYSLKRPARFLLHSGHVSLSHASLNLLESLDVAGKCPTPSNGNGDPPRNNDERHFRSLEDDRSLNSREYARTRRQLYLSTRVRGGLFFFH